MDKLYCKTQLAWVKVNMTSAQECISDNDKAGAIRELDAAARAIQRAKDQIISGQRILKGGSVR